MEYLTFGFALVAYGMSLLSLFMFTKTKTSKKELDDLAYRFGLLCQANAELTKAFSITCKKMKELEDALEAHISSELREIIKNEWKGMN